MDSDGCFLGVCIVEVITQDPFPVPVYVEVDGTSRYHPDQIGSQTLEQSTPTFMHVDRTEDLERFVEVHKSTPRKR